MATLIGAIAGCGASPAPSLIPVPTHDGQTCMAALVSGQLVPDERWVLALEDESGHRWKPLWPPGFGGVLDGSRPAMADDHGRVIAHAGDSIQSSGGYLEQVVDADDLGASQHRVDTVQICGQITVEANP